MYSPSRLKNVNVDALKKLQSEGVKVYPTPQTIELIQNKATQKQFYATHNIPTAPFHRFESFNKSAAGSNKRANNPAFRVEISAFWLRWQWRENRTTTTRPIPSTRGRVYRRKFSAFR